MAKHFTETDISEFYEVFRYYDTGHAGRLPLKDVPHAMIALGHNPTELELSKLIAAVRKESDHDHFDFPEFLEVLALHIQETEPEEQLRTAFKVFDKDGNGNLSASELKSAMSNLGEKLTQADVEYMIKTADIDGDGQVNYEEFIRVMTSK